jgi:NAD(P)-dependent dehydrogenase (short-subunit alcohol dehydrogenase family)
MMAGRRNINGAGGPTTLPAIIPSRREDRMDLNLKNKVAIVTGGSRGIGRAAAAALLKEGAAVMIASKRPASVAAAVEELRPLGRVEGAPCDVAVEADVVRLVSETVERLGRLDVMVANAGISDPYKNLIETSAAEFDAMIAVHLRGTFLCGREAARAMRDGKRPGGRIVTISSTSAFECDPLGGTYNAAKAGILGLTRSMAIDFAEWGIRVNTVAPGWIHTDMAAADLPARGVPIEGLGALRRAGEPEEVAAAILFLASPACDFMTGATLVVDGGQVIVAPKMRW